MHAGPPRQWKSVVIGFQKKSGDRNGAGAQTCFCSVPLRSLFFSFPKKIKADPFLFFPFFEIKRIPFWRERLLLSLPRRQHTAHVTGAAVRQCHTATHGDHKYQSTRNDPIVLAAPS